MRSWAARASIWPLICAFPGYCLTFIWGNWLNSPACFQSLSADIAANRAGLPSIVTAKNYWEARTVCLDPYWQNQWLKHYDFGLVKRGFLGAFLKVFTGDEINVLVLNLLFPLIGFLLIFALIFTVREVSLLRGKALAVFAVLLSVSPFTKVIVETSGDPLHVVALLCFFAIFLGLRLPSSQVRLRPLLHIAVYIIALLIYEGSYLLLLPFLFFDRKIDLARVVCLAASTVLLIGFSRPESAEIGVNIAGSLTMFNPANGLSWAYQAGGGVSPNVGFMFNAKQEFARYLDQPTGYIFRAFRSFVPSISVGLIFGSFMRFRSRDSAISLFREASFVFIFGIPFFLITHDYFRYWMFVICIAIFVVYERFAPSRAEGNQRSMPLETVRGTNDWICFVPLVAFVLVGPFAEDVRTWFPEHAFFGSLFVLMLACLGYAWSEFRSQQLDHASP